MGFWGILCAAFWLRSGVLKIRVFQGLINSCVSFVSVFLWVLQGLFGLVVLLRRIVSWDVIRVSGLAFGV